MKNRSGEVAYQSNSVRLDLELESDAGEYCQSGAFIGSFISPLWT